MTTNRKLLLTVSLGILAAIAGAGVVIQKGESIKIRWYTWKLDSEDKDARNKAFEWLTKKAEKEPEDLRLEGFYRHTYSLSLSMSILNQQVPGHAKMRIGLPLFWFVKNFDIGARIYWRQMTPKAKSRAFHHAALFRDNATVKWLVKRRAVSNAKDDRGDTALDIAVREGSMEIAAFLRAHGAMTGAELKAEAKPKKDNK